MIRFKNFFLPFLEEKKEKFGQKKFFEKEVEEMRSFEDKSCEEEERKRSEWKCVVRLRFARILIPSLSS